MDGAENYSRVDGANRSGGAGACRAVIGSGLTSALGVTGSDRLSDKPLSLGSSQENVEQHQSLASEFAIRWRI